MPTVYACELLVAFIWCLCKKYESFIYVWYMYQYSYLVEQVEVLLSQFEWKSRDSPDRYRSTYSLSFVTPANFPRAVTVRRGWPMTSRIQNLCTRTVCQTHPPGLLVGTKRGKHTVSLKRRQDNPLDSLLPTRTLTSFPLVGVATISVAPKCSRRLVLSAELSQ